MSAVLEAQASRPPLVVVVAYRADDHLRRCLEGLGRSTEVLVVDNDAADSTAQVCAAFGVAYVSTPHNMGFARAVNLGLAQAGGRDVLLLNPDARITPDAIAALQTFLRDPEHHRAAVGPELVSPDGHERASWPMPSPIQAWADALGLSHRLRGRRFVTGAVLLLRSEAIADIGGFDERYFLYAEESDWQQRAQEAGWEIEVAHGVTAEHVGGASSRDSDRRDFHFLTSNRAFNRRWYGTAGSALMRAGTVVAALRRATVGPDRSLGRRRLRQSIQLAPPPEYRPRPSVVHVVCTDSFAGVERSVVDLAAEQHRRGWRVSVVGGDSSRIRGRVPPGVLVLPGRSVLRAYRSLRRLGPVDVAHTHMTAAELATVAAKRSLGGRVVSTRHFAAPRGSTRLTRLVGRLAARRIDAQVAISEFVSESIEGSSRVVLNGVQPSSLTLPRSKSVVVLQRLEAEKHTDVALQAWSLSGLAEQAWTMTVHGRGQQLDELRTLAEDLGIARSVNFAGFTDAPREALASASILLATAPAEPFGLTVAEAMAERTPVVAADGGAHREVLGPAGRYFPPGDAAAAASQLVELAQLADGERETQGQILRDRQQGEFTVERQVDQLLNLYRGEAPRVALLSLEPWDDVWRRNQHLASRLVRNGAVDSLLFVNPPRGGLALRATRHHPEPGVTVVTPPLVIPRRYGGHRLLGAWLRRATADADLWWINDPVAGDAARKPGAPAVYDVTDDWREVEQPASDRLRVVRAEDRLARVAVTVVCSTTLASRWHDRYGVDADLIGNGVDVRAIQTARPLTLDGEAPHVVYVGTVHANRVDVDLLRRIAEELPGTLHLVGPESLDAKTRELLTDHGAQLEGPVASGDVPSWLVAGDVLICPHIVDAFTLSLDAIKAYEYLATSLPVVATPSSGFQSIDAPGLSVVTAESFTHAIQGAVGTGPFLRDDPPDWSDRAREFGAVLERTLAPRTHSSRSSAAERGSNQ